MMFDPSMTGYIIDDDSIRVRGGDPSGIVNMLAVIEIGRSHREISLRNATIGCIEEHEDGSFFFNVSIVGAFYTPKDSFGKREKYKPIYFKR
jgi:hypothetical protein